MGYEYPCQTLSTVPSKVSVTEVKRLMEEDFEDEFDLMNRKFPLKNCPISWMRKQRMCLMRLKPCYMPVCSRLILMLLEILKVRKTLKLMLIV